MTDPAELPEVLGRALDVFASGRPRPVHIEIALDVMQRDAGDAGSFAIPAPAGPPVADPQALDAARSVSRRPSARSSCSAAGPPTPATPRWRSPGASARPSA